MHERKGDEMINTFCKKPLFECKEELVDVALGRKPADTVILNGKLINVCTHEICDNVDVAITAGRIAMVGDCKHTIGENTKIIDATGLYIAPSFIDGHIHIESSMMTASEYAKAVIPHGTSAIVHDPHEICNVCGMAGVEAMQEDAKKTPLKAMLSVPSCVPAVDGFETTGAEITAEDVAKAMQLDYCVGLGEMMNFPGILNNAKKPQDIVKETLKADKIATGHYSLSERGKGLNAYIATGIRCCHESVSAIDALAKMRLGMYALFREGSAWHDLKALSKAITERTIDTRYACVCSDDAHPYTLKCIGHMDYILKRAVEEGIDPITAVQMATINPAQCFRLDNEMGSVTPSKCADIVLLQDLKDFKVECTLIDGEVVAEKGKLTVNIPKSDYPYELKNTMRLNRITPEAFDMYSDKDKQKVHALTFTGGSVIAKDTVVELDVDSNGVIMPSAEKDVMKVAVFERHKGTGNVGKGFVKGFGIRKGAIAQTIAHDAHNLIVIGTDNQDMLLAVNTLIDCGGGMVAVEDGNVLALVPLEIGGLISETPVDEMVRRIDKLQKVWKEMGCNMPSPFMTMGLLSLACIPEIRLTDKGLVDCINFKFIDVKVD